MLRLASAGNLFCFEFSTQFFASAQPVKPSETLRREKYLTNFLRGRGFCGSRLANGVPEICTAAFGIGNASSKSGLGSGEMPRHEHEL